MSNNKIKISLDISYFTKYLHPGKLGWLKFALALVQLLTILAIPVVFLGILSSTAMEMLVWLIAINLIARIIGAMFFGLKLIPSVNYDIIILSGLTFLLVSLIVQMSQGGFVQLSPTGFWAISALFIFSLSTYVYDIAIRTINLRLATFQMVSLGLILVSIFAGSRLTNPELLAIFSLIFQTGLFRTAQTKLGKTLPGLGIIISLLTIIFNFNILLGLLAGLSAMIFGLLSISLERFKINSWKDKKSLILISGILIFIFSIIIAVIANAAFDYAISLNFIEVIGQAYAQLPSRFDTLNEIVFGLGTSGFLPAALGMVLNYGLLSFVSSGLILFLLHRKFRKMKATKYRSVLLACVSVILSAMLLIPLQIMGLIFFLFVFVLILAQDEKSLEISKLKLLDFSNLSNRKSLTKIMPASIWQEIFAALRILFAISLLVLLSPVVINILNILN